MFDTIARRSAARGVFLALSPLAAVLAAACGGPRVDASEAARGRDLFQRTCSLCHGTDARGMPRLGKDLHGNPYVRARTDAELVEFLERGRPANHPLNERGVDMPPRGGNPALTDDDLAAIVAYLRSIQ